MDFLTFCPILVLTNPGCKLTIVKPSSLRSLAKITVSAEHADCYSLACHKLYGIARFKHQRMADM